MIARIGRRIAGIGGRASAGRFSHTPRHPESNPERQQRELERLREEVKERDERIAELQKQIGEKEKQIGEKEKQIADLERQLALRQQNSTNSSKPPSSDGLAGEQRLRGRGKKSRRKPGEYRTLTRFVKDSAYELGSVEEFRRNIFLKYLKARALIVAYDAPREISRIAIKWNKSTKIRRAFAFYFRMFRDKKTGKMRPSGYEPGISIESLDAAKAIYRPIKYKFHDSDTEREEEEDKKFSNVHILDLKTLTSVLTGEVYSFQLIPNRL